MRSRLPKTRLIGAFLSCWLFNFGAFGAHAQGLIDLEPYRAGIEAIVPAFRNVYCTPLSEEPRKKCQETPIVVSNSWAIGAFARPTDDASESEIRITAGTAATFDFMAGAFILSNETGSENACFYDWLSYYLGKMPENQRAIAAGLELTPAKDVVGYARDNQSKNCEGVARLSDHAVQKLMARQNADRASNIEAALSFILLHEMGHVVLGHTAIPIASVTLEQRRRMEMDADNWAIDTSLRAHQCLVASFAPLLIADIQGASLDWERQSDHPLGVRRYLNFLVRTEYGCEHDPVIRAYHDSRESAALHTEMSRLIAAARICLDDVGLGRKCPAPTK